MSLYLEPVSSALSEAAEWGPLGVSEQGAGRGGWVFTRGRCSSWTLPPFLILQEVGKQHETGPLGRKQVVKCAPIVECSNPVADALGKLQNY